MIRKFVHRDDYPELKRLTTLGLLLVRREPVPRGAQHLALDVLHGDVPVAGGVDGGLVDPRYGHGGALADQPHGARLGHAHLRAGLDHCLRILLGDDVAAAEAEELELRGGRTAGRRLDDGAPGAGAQLETLHGGRIGLLGVVFGREVTELELGLHRRRPTQWLEDKAREEVQRETFRAAKDREYADKEKDNTLLWPFIFVVGEFQYSNSQG